MFSGNKSYLYFWILIPFLFVLGLIFNNALDIPLHDIYFETSIATLLSLVCLFLFFSGLAYFLNRKKKFSKSVFRFHLWSYIIGIALIILSSFYSLKLDELSAKGKFIEYQYINEQILAFYGFSLGFILIGLGFLVYLFYFLKKVFRM